MNANLVDIDDLYVLNYCARFLARSTSEPRHDFGQFTPDDRRAMICESWRFPIVDSYFDGISIEDSYHYNTVTFVYDGRAERPTSVEVVGTFGDLYDPLPLKPIRFLGDETGYLALAVRVPKAGVYRYKFAVDGRWLVDPVNPQRERADNGELWSRFFTDGCQVPLVLNRRERDVLGRLVAHLLPFRLSENWAFVERAYNDLDHRASRDRRHFPLPYRLDREVGVVNYIDKLLARGEQHHADDYHVCLGLVDALLRDRYGGLDPCMLPTEVYQGLYQEMDADAVHGWDTFRYGSPRFFLLLLRRHAMTGAFTHPKSGGNSGAVAWAYLESRFRDENGETLFDWRQAIEAPLGHNTDYRG